MNLDECRSSRLGERRGGVLSKRQLLPGQLTLGLLYNEARSCTVDACRWNQSFYNVNVGTELAIVIPFPVSK